MDELSELNFIQMYSLFVFLIILHPEKKHFVILGDIASNNLILN